MNKVLLPLVFAVIALSLIGYQEAFAVPTFITDEPSCESDPVFGDFQSGTCVLDGTHTIPLSDLWIFQIPSKVTGTVHVNGIVLILSTFSNSGTINLIGHQGGASGKGIMQFSATTDYTNECDGVINLIAGTGNTSGSLLILGFNGFSPLFNNFGTITGTNSILANQIAIIFLNSDNPDISTFNNHGTITAPVDVNGDSIFNDNLPSQCLEIGGEIIPLDQTALLLAGVQSVSMWMIPVVLAGAGIGIFVIKRRN